MINELDSNSINWSQLLWRYISTERFVDLLEKNSFYFAAASQFDDIFEGATAVVSPEYKQDPRFENTDPIEKAFSELKRLTKISCWHCAEYESNAMWNLYAQEGKGIAICTTPTFMNDSFVEYRIKPTYGVERIVGGMINYIDLTSVRLNTDMLKRFFYKHKAFEWEKEFRLAISLRNAEEYCVKIPSKGIRVEVDLCKLIQRIIIGPSISIEDRTRIESAVCKAGLKDKLEISTMLYSPRYI